MNLERGRFLKQVLPIVAIACLWGITSFPAHADSSLPPQDCVTALPNGNIRNHLARTRNQAVNIRSAPHLEAPIVTQLHNTTMVRLTGNVSLPDEDGFEWLEVTNSYWVRSDVIDILDENSSSVEQFQQYPFRDLTQFPTSAYHTFDERGYPIQIPRNYADRTLYLLEPPEYLSNVTGVRSIYAAHNFTPVGRKIVELWNLTTSYVRFDHGAGPQLFFASRFDHPINGDIHILTDQTSLDGRLLLKTSDPHNETYALYVELVATGTQCVFPSSGIAIPDHPLIPQVVVLNDNQTTTEVVMSLP